MVERILFIVNPKSGTDRRKEIHTEINKHLDLQRYAYDLVFTEYAKHGAELAWSAAAEGFDIVVAVGGDGSVNDVINGLYGSKTILGIVPKGSGNGLARSLGIPTNLPAAIRLLNFRNLRTIDLGEANGMLFASNAGFGFDVDVIEQFAGSRRRGFLAYLSIILRNLWGYQPKAVELDLGGETIEEEVFMVTIANAKQLGYGFVIAPDALLSDGLFDVVLIKKFSKLNAFPLAFRAFQQRITDSKHVKVFRTNLVTVKSQNMKFLQLDGELKPCSPTVSCKLLPQALTVIGSAH